MPAVIVNASVTGALVLPEASLANAVGAWAPGASGFVGMQLHVPFGCTTVVHSVGPFVPSFTVTVEPGSPVPVIMGVLFEVLPPFAGPVITGAAGGVVSTVNGTVVGWLMFPAGSVATTPRVCGPLASGVVGVQLHVPLGCTVVVQINVPVG